MSAPPPLPCRWVWPVALATLLTAAAVHAGDPAAAKSPSQLVAVLQTNASFYEKARACQRLGEIGTQDCVPALAALLESPELGAYARSGLEGIPGPGAAAAFREAAGRLKGPALAGVVNSLGTLRDRLAVDVLAKVAADRDSGAAREALLALGNLASPQSVVVIEKALADGPGVVQTAAAAACLLAAERERNSGNPESARRLYDLVRGTNAPLACRVGATRGAILARGTNGVPFLVEQLRSEEAPIRKAALLTIREIPGDALASALNAEVARAKPELQGQLLLALVDCHNGDSIRVITSLAEGTDASVRTTALTVLGQMGAEAAPALLAALEKPLSAQDKTIVFNGLKGLPGAAVDALLLQALVVSPQPGSKIELIRLLGSRGYAQASGEILKQASGANREVSLAALAALQSLSGAGEVPGLILLVKGCPDEAIRETAESALAGACRRSGTQTPGAEAVLAELAQTSKPGERNSWIRVLATVGYAKALPVIQAAASDADDAVADNALRQLGRWPDPAPMETLLAAMDTAARPALLKRALGSVLALAAAAADEGQAPEAALAQWMQRANARADSVAEKKRVLGILGHSKTVASFRLLASYLDDAELRNEAASGVVQIAPAFAKGEEAGAVKAALEKIAASLGNAELRGQAARIAKSIAAQGR